MSIRHLAAFGLALMLAGCGSVELARTIEGNGIVTTEERQIAPFTRIQFSTIGRVEINPGSEATLSITGESNIIPQIETTVSDGALIIEAENNAPLEPTEEIVITITTPELNRVLLGGAGQLTVSEVATENFSALIGGAGTMTVGTLTAEAVEIRMSGRGTFVANGGEAASLDVLISGDGTVDTSEMEASAVELSLTGSGEAIVWAVDTLDVTITWAGLARYYGSPEITQEINGIGEVTSYGEK